MVLLRKYNFKNGVIQSQQGATAKPLSILHHLAYQAMLLQHKQFLGSISSK